MSAADNKYGLAAVTAESVILTAREGDRVFPIGSIDLRGVALSRAEAFKHAEFLVEAANYVDAIGACPK